MDDLKNMYIKVITFDICILFFMCLIYSLINVKYIIPGVLGLTVALGNLIISGIATNDALVKEKVNFITYFSFSFKVVTASIIGVILFAYNKYYLIVYVIGYISQFVSLILYAVSINNE